ncbi:MAG: TadE/TadG family type IV pilus assembly protein [Candidatus Angelobacter sp.]
MTLLKAKSHRLPGRERERGQSSIEFALSIIVVMFILACCWEVLMTVYTANVLGDAAKEGVRYAIVHGANSTQCSGPNAATPCAYDPDKLKVISRVTDYGHASLHDISAMSVTVTYPDGTNDAPNRVVVTVTYTYLPYVNLSFFHPVLTTHAQGRIVF